MKSKVRCCDCGREQTVTHHESQSPLEALGWEGEWAVYRSITMAEPLIALCPDCRRKEEG